MHVARALLVVAVLFWLFASPPPTGVVGAEGGTADQPDDNGPGADAGDNGNGSCGRQPGDADQVAAVRALADENCDCGSATNHGKYVGCVARVAQAAVRDGSLREQCKDDVVHCADQSTCGRPRSLTCCRTDAHGHAKCSIKPRDAACRAPKGGSACVGTAASCCDACSSGTCAPPETTTTTLAQPPTTTTTAEATTTTAAQPTTSTTTTTSAPTTTTLGPTSTTTTTTPPTTTTSSAAPTTTTPSAAPTTTTRSAAPTTTATS